MCQLRSGAAYGSVSSIGSLCPTSDLELYRMCEEIVIQGTGEGRDCSVCLLYAFPRVVALAEQISIRCQSFSLSSRTIVCMRNP